MAAIGLRCGARNRTWKPLNRGVVLLGNDQPRDDLRHHQPALDEVRRPPAPHRSYKHRAEADRDCQQQAVLRKAHRVDDGVVSPRHPLLQ